MTLKGLMDELSSAGVWKFMSGMLATALLTMIIAWPKDVVSRADFEQFKKDEREAAERAQNIQTAKDVDLSSQVHQLQVDTGRIAEHLGVAAHPSSNH